MKKISVIIPAYNRAHTLTRAIDSVLQQSLAPDEIFVIDDGSTDNTQALLKTYGHSIQTIYQPNQGVSCARNLGINACSGQWLAFLDSDDTWHPKKLAMQFEAVKNNPLKICHTEEIWYRNGVRVNPKLKHKKKGGHIFEACLPLCVISPSSVMIHREVFNEVGLFDESLPACEDYDLWLRICAKHEVLFLEEPLTYKYGGHDDQLSKKHWGMDRFRIYALKKLLLDNSLDEKKREATKIILEEKIKIFNTGARKRGPLRDATKVAPQGERSGRT